MRSMIALSLLLLAACSADMRGAVHSSAGQPLGPAKFHYEETGIGSGSITAALPDGELFNGSYTAVTALSSSSGWAKSDSGWAYVSGTSTANSGQFEAVLLGDRGHSMQCLFRGGPFGGVGTCRVSDGRMIDMQW
jgi:hypothetical protein